MQIIFHGGPTNSGKTYAALQRLKEAKNGLYLGPLRLLAAEVYESLTADGSYTNLYTGQEQREIAFSTHSSATVEMASVDDEHDIVVVDEIQMIADPSRGASWAKALLGLRCKEIHLCGGLEARNIVEKIVKACGDELEVHTYERFSELQLSRKSLSNDPNVAGAYRNVSQFVRAFVQSFARSRQNGLLRKTHVCVSWATHTSRFSPACENKCNDFRRC